MEAIILAGGLGTRLKSVVNDRPKVLALISDQPFLMYIIEFLKKNGVKKFIFSLGYLSNQITEYISQLDIDIYYEYSFETIQLGTGGAIKKAMNLVNNDNVIVVNADTYFNVDLKKMMQHHVHLNSDCTIALKALKNFNRYGTVELNNDSRVISFIEKKETTEGLISAGYTIFNKKKFLDYTIEYPQVFSVETDFLQKIKTLNIYGFLSEGFFIDIGIPDDYKFAQLNLKNILQQTSK